MATENETPETKLVNFRLPVDLVEQARKCAKKTDRHLTGFVAHALREQMKREGCTKK